MNKLQEVKKCAVRAIIPKWDQVPAHHWATICAFPFSYSIGRTIIGFCQSANIKPEDGRILIVGAAGGRDFHWLTGFGYTADVLDLGRHSWATRTYVGDACQLETWQRIPEKYSLIVMCDVLEHLPEDFAALRHARTVMKDDGYLFLSVPYCHNLEVTHIRSYSEVSLERLLAVAGYNVTWRVDRPGLLEAFPRLLNLFNYIVAMLMPTAQTGGNVLHALLKAEYVINDRTRKAYRWFGRSPQKGIILVAKPIEQNSLADYVDINRKMFVPDSRGFLSW